MPSDTVHSGSSFDRYRDTKKSDLVDISSNVISSYGSFGNKPILRNRKPSYKSISNFDEDSNKDASNKLNISVDESNYESVKNLGEGPKTSQEISNNLVNDNTFTDDDLKKEEVALENETLNEHEENSAQNNGVSEQSPSPMDISMTDLSPENDFNNQNVLPSMPEIDNDSGKIGVLLDVPNHTFFESDSTVQKIENTDFYSKIFDEDPQKSPSNSLFNTYNGDIPR